MKVGDTIWEFSENHRVYRHDKDGRSTGGPIYREHWRPRTIIGETTRSWLLGNTYRPTKVPKAGARHYAFSPEEVDRDVWIHDNRYAIVRAVDCCREYDKLKAIAEILRVEGIEQAKAAER